MTRQRQSLGRLGEQLAARELEAVGWRVIARNARPAGVRGELDLVAIDRREVVFVEVKTGRAGAVAGPQSPAELVDHRKRARLRRLAGAWMRENRTLVPVGAGMRMDVYAQRLDADGRPVWREHLRAAF